MELQLNKNLSLSPEEIADKLLNQEFIKKEQEGSLFLKNAAVLVFDGLIVWRGNINMGVAIPSLKMLEAIVGLPVAIVEDQAFGNTKKRKFRVGKHVGPGNWIKNSWDTIFGLDEIFLETYTEDGRKKVPTVIPTRNKYYGGARFAHENDIDLYDDDNDNYDPVMWGIL
jgi:hypothetical protein